MKERTDNIALRLAAFRAAVPIVWLSKEFSARPLDVLLTIILFMAPNIAIAICPARWERFQIGMGIGYPVSMIPALLLYSQARAGTLMPTEPPTPPPPVGAYKVALLLNVVLLLISAVVLIWHRRQLGDLFGVTLAIVGGLAYPFLAFVLIAVLSQI